MTKRKLILSMLLALIFVLICGAAAYADDSVYEEKALSFNGAPSGSLAYTIKGSVYLTVSDFTKYGNCESLTIDEDKGRVEIDVASLDAYFADAQTTEYIKSNAGICYVPIKSFKDGKWISLNVLGKLAGIDYSLDGDTLSIFTGAAAEGIGVVTAEAQAAGIHANVTLPAGTRAFLEAETASFYKIKTLFGEHLYVSKDCFDPHPADAAASPDLTFPAKAKSSFEGRKINLVWASPSGNGVTALAPEAGLGIDVLSPRWFDQIVDGDGDVINNGDKGYVRLAHEHGYQVWVCVTNLYTSTGSTRFTSEVLSDEQLRDRVIAKYLFYSCLYDVDGINVDYEDLVSTDRAGFTAFIETLSYYCGRLGLYSSVDIPGQAGYTQFNYAALGRACDYVVVMAYDYYYSGSTYAGPVSGRSEYYKHMKNLISYVGDPSKMLMGVPLYTALWTTDSSNKKLSYSVYRMSALKKLVSDNGATPVWDESSGQYYAQWQKGSYISKIWLEDMRSLAVKLSVINELGLGGSACWQYAYAAPSDLDIFRQVYRGGVDPLTIAPPF